MYFFICIISAQYNSFDINDGAIGTINAVQYPNSDTSLPTPTTQWSNSTSFNDTVPVDADVTIKYYSNGTNVTSVHTSTKFFKATKAVLGSREPIPSKKPISFVSISSSVVLHFFPLAVVIF
eukprot:NODE_82_length_22708_cov_0.383476.p13 type:complete len:122 gc:universal NODE_82_length_22708_cov_0.383476:12381-12016(-)